MGTLAQTVDPLNTIPFVIPTVPGLPDYTLRTRLDGRDYNLRFLWNEREARWSMSILTPEDEVLAYGIRLVLNWPLLRFYQYDDRLPPGEMMAMDLSPDKSAPGLDDLGVDKRVQLTYFAVTDR